jgi:hypothetical protein
MEGHETGWPRALSAGSLNLFTQERCAWEARPSDESWITITSGRVGIGNATVTFTAGANTTGRVRKWTISIADQVFTLKQKP